MKTMRILLLLLLAAAPLSHADGLFDKVPLFGSKQPKYLDPDKAFGLEIEARDGRTLIASFSVAPKYYLYRDKIKFSVADPGVQVAKWNLPPGELKHDANFGDMQVFHRPFQAEVLLERNGTAAQTVTLQATYQGCSEEGLCYAPIDKAIKVDLPAVAEGAAPAQPAAQAGATVATATAPAAQVTPEPQAAPGVPESDASRIARLFKQGSFWLVVSSFFGMGVLLSLTPCMYPMVPILSGIIVGRGRQITHLHGFLLSLSYVLGMASIDAAAGVAAGFSGDRLSDALQTPWVLGSFAGVFVLLSLSMFGLYELRLPSALQTRLTGASNKFHGGHISGVFAMGALSAVIVSPCITAPMGGGLAYIAHTHDAFLGGFALFFLGLGMGVPLLVIGASAGTLLPKAGAWMESIQRFFGVLLLGVAIWIIAPLIPVTAQMLLWAVLLIVSAVYLHALDALPQNASNWHKLWKGVGVLVLLVGIAYLIGALSGARDVTRPLGVIGSARAQAAEGPEFALVKNMAELDARIAQAGGRIVMLDFYADTCTACKDMERDTFSDARVQAKLGSAVLLRADLSANNEDDKALRHQFKIFSEPNILFFGKDGKEQSDLRVTGYQGPAEFLQSLQRAGL